MRTLIIAVTPAESAGASVATRSASLVLRSDFKREKRGQHRLDIGSLVSEVVSLLAEDKPLPEKNRDHPLSGVWDDHRECHLKPDLLLIYRKPDEPVLQLVLMGSHRELFG
jgi:mRNA interferase YafQ